MSEFSTVLFARPSFLEGMGRILDFADMLQEYNKSLTPQQADRLALCADWGAVGEDIEVAVRHYQEGSLSDEEAE
jgi:hypothetical protein